jgi:hypothetical protein
MSVIIELTMEQSSDLVLASLREDLKMANNNIKDLRKKAKIRELSVKEEEDLSYDLGLKQAIKVLLVYYGGNLEEKC